MATGWAAAIFASLSGVVLAGGMAQLGFSVAPATSHGLAQSRLKPVQERRSSPFAEKGAAEKGAAEKEAAVIVPSFPGAPLSPTQDSASYPTLNSKQLDHQLQLYVAYLAKFGPPDILLVGSSRSLQGIDPIALQNALAQQGYPSLKVFNFGINGATAQVIDWLLRRLLTPEQLPKLIVWADGSRAFNNGRTDHTYNNILASEGHQRLTAGVRPWRNRTAPIELGRICMDLLPVPVLQQSKSVGKEVKPPPLASAGQRSPCAQPLKVVLQDISSNFSSSPSSESAWETAGLQIVTARFNPTSYFRRFARVSGFYDADYQNFNLVGKQTEALERVLDFVKTQQIPLVFVNLPLTATYLDASRTDFDQRFRSQMQRLARPNRFLFKDLTRQPALSQDQYFADPSHLNRFGAIVVANSISQDLVTPLSQIFQRAANPLETKKP